MYAHLLPSTLKLGASRYKIVARDNEWREKHGVDGQVRFDDMEIDLVSDRPASELLNTLVHEILHVCYREWQIKPKCGEERTVTALGFALTAIYAQNPGLLHTYIDLLEADDG